MPGRPSRDRVCSVCLILPVERILAYSRTFSAESADGVVGPACANDRDDAGVARLVAGGYQAVLPLESADSAHYTAVRDLSGDRCPEVLLAARYLITTVCSRGVADSSHGGLGVEIYPRPGMVVTQAENSQCRFGSHRSTCTVTAVAVVIGLSSLK